MKIVTTGGPVETLGKGRANNANHVKRWSFLHDYGPCDPDFTLMKVVNHMKNACVKNARNLGTAVVTTTLKMLTTMLV